MVGGCPNTVNTRELCGDHGKKPCSKDGCTTDACTTNAFSMRGKCRKHGSKTAACSVEGCTADARARGGCGKHGRLASVRSTSAPLPSKPEAGAASTAVAARKCARRKAAPLLQKHVVSAPSTVHMEPASPKDAPPAHSPELRIAANTAAERRSRAPWRGAPQPLKARVSARNTAAVQANALLVAAPTDRRETCGRPAQPTAA